MPHPRETAAHYIEVFTPMSMLRRRELCPALADPFQVATPPGWRLRPPPNTHGEPDRPVPPLLNFSQRPRPLAPLPFPPLRLHLLLDAPAAIQRLLREEPALYLAYEVSLREWAEFGRSLGAPPGLSRRIGLVRLDPERALAMLGQPELGRFALVGAPSPAFFARAGEPNQPEGPLCGVLGCRLRAPLAFEAMHGLLSHCAWLLHTRAGVGFLYSAEDQRDLFPELPLVGFEALPGGRADGPPIDPALLEGAPRALDLSWQEVTDLRALLRAPQLEALNVDGLRRLDIDTLRQLRGLRQLSMAQIWVEDLSFLEELPALEALTLSVEPAQGWGELLRLPRLRRLDLWDEPLPDEVLVNLVGVSGPGLRARRRALAARVSRGHLDRLLTRKIPSWEAPDLRQLCAFATAVEAPSLNAPALRELRSRAEREPRARAWLKGTLRTLLRREGLEPGLRSLAEGTLAELWPA